MSNPTAHPLASPELTVVIVNFNSWPDVQRLATAIAAEPEVESGRCELVIVDNASAGPIPDEMAQKRRGIRLICRDENGGFAAGVNAGWRSSRSPWLLLLNPDIEVAPGFIACILHRLEDYQTRPQGPPAIVGFGLRNADGSRQPSVGVEPGLVRSLWGQFLPRSRRKYQADCPIDPAEVPWVTGACALVQSNLMHLLDGMDEKYFLYYEEVALCRSARNRGQRVEFDPSLEVVHLRPLQNRRLTPRMRVITRHSKLLYFQQFRPRWEFRVLTWLIEFEAIGRGRFARWQGDQETASAWKLIAQIAQFMRQGKSIQGLDVVRWVDEMHRNVGRVKHASFQPNRAPIKAKQPSKEGPK